MPVYPKGYIITPKMTWNINTAAFPLGTRVMLNSELLAVAAERKIFVVIGANWNQVRTDKTGEAWYPAHIFTALDPIDELLEAVDG